MYTYDPLAYYFEGSFSEARKAIAVLVAPGDARVPLLYVMLNGEHLTEKSSTDTLWANEQVLTLTSLAYRSLLAFKFNLLTVTIALRASKKPMHTQSE